ncbi:hypothetical protein D3C85_1511380 [compost metagenome]
MRSTSRLAAIKTPRNSIDGVRKSQARAVGETPRLGRDSAALTEWVKGWCSIAKGLVNGKQLTDTRPDDTEVQCGSGLAREEAVSADINVECHTAFASKPAPTFDLWRFKGLRAALDQEEKISV